MPPVGAHVLPTAHPTGKGLPLPFSAGERHELEEKHSLDQMEKKAKLSAGYSCFYLVFIFKPWRGEKKSQWGACSYFCFFSFHSFPLSIQKWALFE